MRTGIMLDVDQPLEQVVAEAKLLGSLGVDSLWCSQIFGLDALTLLAVIGREVPGVELGTGVVPIYPRHPVMLAAQALTVQSATGGRLALGIGLSHQIVVESVFGMSFDRPARAMREYLSILMPLLAGEQVTFEGETVRANTFGPLGVVAPSPPVLLAALGTTMLGLAGSVADGTVTWMTGLDTIESHIVPTILAAVEAAGRKPPRIVVALPVCVTGDVDGARKRAGEVFDIYGNLPSYRAMLDREGVSGPSDVAVVGNEQEVAAMLSRFSDAGATDFVGAPFGVTQEIEHTRALLAEF